MYLVEGIILVILGLAAIVVPPLAGLATTLMLGWLFLLSGVVGLIATFGHRRRGSGGRCSRLSSPFWPAASCWRTRPSGS